MVIPQLTDAQLSAARQAATQARRARADLKAAVRDSQITFLQALDKCLADETLSHIKVVDLIRCIPRVGIKRAEEIMTRLGISQSRRVRGLGRHQIDALRQEFA